MGKKRFDRRGTVGTHHYVDLKFLDGGIPELVELKKRYTFIAIDNNISDTHKLREFDWNTLEKPPLVFFGEEGLGLTEEVLNLCDYRIEIEQYGSVRSLNVGTSSGLLLYEFVRYLKSSKVDHKWQKELCGENGNAPSGPSQLTLL